MEAAISAIANEIFSRMVSFLVMKYKGKTTIEDKLERLQELLLRIHTVVEEADIRYITNRNMLMQLKVLVESMYHGYHILEIFRHKHVLERISHGGEMRSSVGQLTSYSSSSSSSIIRLKRSRTVSGATRGFPKSNNLQNILQNLEALITNMNEFVVLLGGCDRYRRPYDTYLYTDNFMFGRHVEKQHIINILLQDYPGQHGAPMVLPIIGGFRVGKKTLAFHVCKNDRIKSYFSSTMFLNGDNIWSMDQVKFRSSRTLAIVEFITDLDDDDWVKFYSSLKRAAVVGSKLIIISRIQNLARHGTVEAVYLKSLPHEEYKYLFKRLVFGSMDEKDYPNLAAVASELATVLGGSLITANVVADLLRGNHDFKFWLRILNRFKGMVDNNLLMYGEHPKEILENEHPINISTFNSARLSHHRLMPPRVERDHYPKQKLATYIYFGDLIRGSISVPNDEFVLVCWESRLPPYTKLVTEVHKLCCVHSFFFYDSVFLLRSFISIST